MSSYAALTQNENMKIYRRPRTWVMTGLVVFMLILVTVLMQINRPTDAVSSDWRAQVTQSIANDQSDLQNPEKLTPFMIERLQKDIKMSQYQLEHNIKPDRHTLWGTIKSLTPLLNLTIIFTIVVAADMIAAEFTAGTIKLLLIRPASRFRILMSKYMASLQFALFLTVITFVVSFLIGGVVNGFADFNTPELYVGADGLVHEQSMMMNVMKQYGFLLVTLLIYVTFAFMISSAFRSSSMAISLSLVGLLAGPTIVAVLSKYTWSKYILFANTDLSVFFGGTPMRPEMTLTFSVLVLAVYFVLFHLISWFMFTKRDVAA
ncbi:ABC transporter permease [Paenibacillus sp. N1-5-1-14]|uniref:ABC transporter permease n=1 Tax=Paenibacillus radicibacter TaxID=2972488 RepID=UPI0021593040|nr:ABC transporter permease [Paenibacillus radicibacter]MCR8642596.1 ABC transporter permease [Paenibacillus radicibacter]